MSSAPAATSTNVHDWHARLVERAAAMLGHSIVNTEGGKLDWCPSVDGASKCRSIYAQAAECVQLNRMAAMLLKGETPAPPSGDAAPGFTSPEEANEQVRASAKELADALRALPQGGLDETYTTPMGPMPGALLVEIALGNMHYHAGQVNFIQLLYGDTEFRIPPEMFE